MPYDTQDDFQIIRIVVLGVAVLVMNDLIGLECATEFLGSDNTMLIGISANISQWVFFPYTD